MPNEAAHSYPDTQQDDHNVVEALTEGNLKLLNQLIAGLDKMDGATFINQPGSHSASIGMHIRHIIEFYQEFFKMLHSNDCEQLCYDQRRRNVLFETSKSSARKELEDMKVLFVTTELSDIDLRLSVTVDPDQPLFCLRTTKARELFHLIDHTTHHMAIIKMIAQEQNVIFDENFGLANSTQKERKRLGAQ